jgi:antirestriction protein
MERQTDTCQIYVAPLAAYSAGHDTGAWITVIRDESALRSSITALLTRCPYSTPQSDWAIHDYQGFYGLGHSLGEHPALADLVKAVELIDECGEMAAKLIEHFCGDVDEAVRHLRDKYLGCFSSLDDYAQEVVNSQLQGGTIPDVIAAYVDYTAMAADWLLGGEIFTIEFSSFNERAEEEKTIHIFTNRPTE